jgi:diguanylate cyclase
LAIKLSDHKRALRALSRIDSLTGLLNHGSWKDLLHLKFHKCQQQQTHGTIALIDIDHFKQINDTHGHIAGDAVLRQLSLELRRHLRENDLAGRYGGDEFCVILPRMNQEEAAQVMERMRETFSNYRAPHIPELRVSLSIGLADFQPSFTSAAMWLNAADRALYAAKDNGRNRVNVSDERVAYSA